MVKLGIEVSEEFVNMVRYFSKIGKISEGEFIEKCVWAFVEEMHDEFLKEMNLIKPKEVS